MLYRALDRLREGYRTVVILFEIEGLSCDEIAELKNLSVTAVWARLSRGRVQLLRELERMQRSRPWR